MAAKRRRSIPKHISLIRKSLTEGLGRVITGGAMPAQRHTDLTQLSRDFRPLTHRVVVKKRFKNVLDPNRDLRMQLVKASTNIVARHRVVVHTNFRN